MGGFEDQVRQHHDLGERREMTAILSRDLPADGETFDSVEAVCPLVPEVDRHPGGGPVAAVVLTACGGERHDSGTEAKGKSRAAVAADRATAARDAVWDDIRTAVTAGDFEPPRFIAADSLLGPCEVGAVVRAGTKPDPEAVAEVVTELKDRGWHQQRQGSTDVNDAWGLERQGWVLNFVAGTVSTMCRSAPPTSASTCGASGLSDRRRQPVGLLPGRSLTISAPSISISQTSSPNSGPPSP